MLSRPYSAFASEDILTQLLTNIHQILPNIHLINIILYRDRFKSNTTTKQTYLPTNIFKRVSKQYVRVLHRRDMSYRQVQAKMNESQLFVIESVFTRLGENYCQDEFCLCGELSAFGRNSFILFQIEDAANIDILLDKCHLTLDSNILFFYFTNNSKTIIVEEAYKINGTSSDLKHDTIANYTNGKGLHISRKSLLKQRRDLNGYVFKALTAVWPPFVTSLKNYTDEFGHQYYAPEGIYIDIMNMLSSQINATIKYMIPAKRQSWSDMTNAVAEGKYDMSVTGFSQTLRRYNQVDFSFGLMQTSLRIIYPKGFVDSTWNTYEF